MMIIAIIIMHSEPAIRKVLSSMGGEKSRGRDFHQIPAVHYQA